MILDKFNLSEKQKEQFRIYADFLVLENKKYNLTTITDIDEIYIKHFYDSLIIQEVIEINNIKTILDIGSGAGFPIIPIKIAFEHLHVTIIEPTLKRCNFLKQLCELLELTNVLIINKRSEDISEEHRDYFDIVTARAVANLPVLLELTIPYVKVNGCFLALKGSSYNEELEKSINAINKLRSKLVDTYKYDLPSNLGKRVIIKIIKINKTNRIYPRKYKTIKKNHL